MLLAGAGAYAARRVRLVRGSAWCYAGLVLMMTPLAWELWQKIGLLKVVQFPWRILSVTASLQVMLGAALIPALRARLKPRLLVGCIVAMLVAVAAWQAPQFRTMPGADAEVELAAHRSTLLSTFNSYGGDDDFRPVNAATKLPLARRDGQMAALDDKAVQAGATLGVLPESNQYHIVATVESPVDASMTIHQFYFPGWRVLINGVPIEDSELRSRMASDGRLRLSLPKGTSRVEARYGGPPGGAIRFAVVGLAACLLATSRWWMVVVRQWSVKIVTSKLGRLVYEHEALPQ